MAATCTLVAGPNNLGPDMKVATYTIVMDTSYATGGEAIDLTGEFDYISYCAVGANDTAADNLYEFDVIAPSASTTVTSSNVLIYASWSPTGTSGEVFKEFTNTGDLSSIGALQLIVVGK